MPIRARLRGVEDAFRELREETLEIVEGEVDSQTAEALEALQEETPVDTGQARDSWFAARARPDITRREVESVIYNTTDYIDELNEGSSRQAPARFIESTVLRFFDPDGVIVQRSNRRS